jgi:predicted ribosomally synthesized peptide with SipW-like signal peptide
MKKSTKRTTLATAGILTIGALAGVIGSMSYFTDTETTTNRFIVGNVDITMYESQLHRQNSGRQGSFGALASDPDYCDWNANPNDSGLDSNTGLIKGSYEKARYCTPGMNANEGDASTITAVANGHTRTGFNNANRTWGYTDATIEADAETYKAVDDQSTPEDESGYFTRVSQNIVPGQWVRKFTYVKNESESSDAYVLIRYMVPTAYADNIDVKVPGTPYEEDVHADIDGIQGYFTALTIDDTTGDYVAYPGNAADAMDGYTGYVETIDNVEYRIYAAVTTDVVKPGEMTFWSPVNTIRLKTTVTNEDSTDPTYVDPATQIDVKVDAQAIQAKTFSNAIEAINNL